jgi:hypothetical protein
MHSTVVQKSPLSTTSNGVYCIPSANSLLHTCEVTMTKQLEPLRIPSPEEQPTVDLVTVAAPAWGIHSPTVIYRMAANNEFPFAVKKVGGKWRVSTVELRRSLSLDLGGAA